MTHAPGMPSSKRRALFVCVLAATLLGTGGSELTVAADAQAETLKVSGGEIRLILVDAELAHARERLRAWTARSAETVARYYGRFASVRFDDEAPRAAIRRLIMAPASAPAS